jgi:pimeloyl-ACP methyl ester carboxylesterase
LGYLDALAIRWPIVLVGLCLGAALAVDLAAVRPDRVAGLVLTGTTPGGRSSVATRAPSARGEASSLLRHVDLNALAQYDLPRALGALTHPTLFLEETQDPLPSAARRYAGAVRAFLANLPLDAELLQGNRQLG